MNIVIQIKIQPIEIKIQALSDLVAFLKQTDAAATQGKIDELTARLVPVVAQLKASREPLKAAMDSTKNQ